MVYVLALEWFRDTAAAGWSEGVDEDSEEAAPVPSASAVPERVAPTATDRAAQVRAFAQATRVPVVGA